MGDVGTLSYCELRAKEVVNVIDGRRLGRIIDIIFCGAEHGEVKGIVVPFSRRFFFSRAQEVFVPWNCIRKIGEDVILVDLILEPAHGFHRKRRRYDAFEDGRFDEREQRVRVDAEPAESKKEPGGKPHFSVHTEAPKKKEQEPPPEGPGCDRKCEKCMLFDCGYRWKDI